MKNEYPPIGKITGEESIFVETVKSIGKRFKFKTADYRYGLGDSGYGALILEKTWKKTGRLALIGVRYFLGAKDGPYITIWESKLNGDNDNNKNGFPGKGVKSGAAEDFYEKVMFEGMGGKFTMENLGIIIASRLAKYQMM